MSISIQTTHNMYSPFSLPTQTIANSDDEDEVSYESWRVVMVIPAEKMEVVAKKMTDILGSSIEGKVSSLR